MNSQKKLEPKGRIPEDEIQFKELLKNPVRLYGLIFPLFIVILLLFGIFFVQNISTASFNGQPTSVADTNLVKKEVELKKGAITAAFDLGLLKNPTPQMVARGKELFNTTCKTCHGENGMGDGPGGATLVKKPRNFHSVDGWTNGRNIDQMFKTLQEGIVKNGMVAYDFMPVADRFALISYIRTFAKFPDVTDDQLINLDGTYNLSAGTVVPNQIPVSTAVTKLTEDWTPFNDQYLRFEKRINSSEKTAALDLLKKSSVDIKKVFSSFVKSGANQTLDNYVLTVLANPINSGFEPNVAQLSKEDWKVLYDYLKTVTM